MKYCDLLETFLDGRLTGDSYREFEVHLAVCEECRVSVAHWRSVKQTYAHWVESNTRPDDDRCQRLEPPAFVASVLEAMGTERVSPRTSKRRSLSARHYVAAAAALLCILGSICYFVAGMGRTKPNPPLTATRPAEPRTFSAVFITNGVKTDGVVKSGSENVIEAPVNGRILASLKEDRLGIDSSSKLRVSHVGPDRTEILLNQGTTAFEISPRLGDSRFLVKAGGVSVEVIGTRFSIAMDEDNAVTVCVGRGKVSVFSEEWRVELKAGSSMTVSQGVASPPTSASDREMEVLTRLLSDDIVRPADHVGDTAEPTPSTIASPLDTPKMTEGPKRSVSPQRNIEKWKSLIIDGKVRKAEHEIGDYLMSVPRDSEALMLLATCQKKQARYRKAVASYKRVLASTEKKYSNRARYFAGELSFSKLRDFKGAVELFEDYLRHASPATPNRAEARLMLAEALLGIGADVRAKRVLTEIVVDYGRTPIANRARALANQLSEREEMPK